MPEPDARARIAAQADDVSRRAAADVWLTNEATPEGSGPPSWSMRLARLEPFEANVRHGIRSRLSHPTLSAPDPTWPAQAARLLARVSVYAVGPAAVTLDHIGRPPCRGWSPRSSSTCRWGSPRSTSPTDPGSSMDALRGLRAAGGGLARQRQGRHAVAQAAPRLVRPRTRHPRARPRGGVARVAWALMFRDWLRADAGERAGYASMKTGLATSVASVTDYAEAKEPWFEEADLRARAWAASTGWRPPAA